MFDWKGTLVTGVVVGVIAGVMSHFVRMGTAKRSAIRDAAAEIAAKKELDMEPTTTPVVEPVETTPVTVKVSDVVDANLVRNEAPAKPKRQNKRPRSVNLRDLTEDDVFPIRERMRSQRHRDE